MKIKSISLYLAVIPLNITFSTSLGSRDTTKNIYIKLESDDGLVGWGECCPYPLINGESPETAMVVGKMLAENLIGADPTDLEGIMSKMDSTIYGNTSIKSAIDIACHDIKAKSLNIPLYEMLGGTLEKELITDYTISVAPPEVMAAKAIVAKEAGYQTLKIKLGKTGTVDVERIKAIREAIGFDVKLRVDANQGWKIQEAISTLTSIAPYNIQYCEEPINRRNSFRLKKVTNNAPIKIMADESLLDHYDARMLIKNNQCDYFNIKLGKSSGLLKATKILKEAEEAQIDCQIGGFLESKLVFTANCHLAHSSAQVKFYDFDSPLFMAIDPIVGGMRYKENGLIELPETAGLGLSVDEEFLAKCECIIVNS